MNKLLFFGYDPVDVLFFLVISFFLFLLIFSLFIEFLYVGFLPLLDDLKKRGK